MKSLTQYILEQCNTPKLILEAFTCEISETSAEELEKLATTYKLRINIGEQKLSPEEETRFLKFYYQGCDNSWWKNQEHYVLMWDSTPLVWVVGKRFAVHGKFGIAVSSIGWAGVVDNLENLFLEACKNSQIEIVTCSKDVDIDKSKFTQVSYSIFNKKSLNKVANLLACTSKEINTELKKINSPEFILIQ